MPDVASSRHVVTRLSFFLVLVLLPCLLSNSCSSKSPLLRAYARDDISGSAAADYQFLIYQDLLRQGKKEEALTALERLVQAAPSPELYVELANLCWGLAKREKATETLEQAVAAYPDNRQITFYLANAYQLRRMPDKAEAALNAFLTKHPGDAAALQELASLLIDAGKYQEAAQALDRIPDKDRTAAALFYRAKAAAGLEKRKEAIAFLKKAVEQDASLVPAWAELGVLQEQEGDLKGAEESYEKLLTQGEGSPEIRLKLIKIALKLKNPAKAVKILQQTTPEKSLLLEAMTAFIEAGYPDQARQILDKLAKQSPPNPDLLFYKALFAYEGEKNPKKAMDILAQVPKDSPNYDKSLSFRIQIALDQNQTSKALDLVREARERYPDKKDFAVLEAAIHDRTGNVQAASDALKAAVDKWPDDTDMLYRYGVTLEKLKRRDEAMAVMEKILTLDPQYADALNFLGYSLAEENRDLDRALELIQKALEKEPENAFFLDSLAWIQFRRGSADEAWQSIQRAVTQPVKDAVIWEHYGDIAAAAGRKAEAITGYRKALELKPDNAAAVKRKLEALQ